MSNPTVTIGGTPLPLTPYESKAGNTCWVLCKAGQSPKQARSFGVKIPALADFESVTVEVEGAEVELKHAASIVQATGEEKVPASERRVGRTKVSVNGEDRNFTVVIRDLGEGWNVKVEGIPLPTGNGGGQKFDLNFAVPSQLTTVA